MKSSTKILNINRRLLQTLLSAFIYILFALLASDSLANEPAKNDLLPLSPLSVGTPDNVKNAQQFLNKAVNNVDIDCEGDELCEAILEICENEFLCIFMLRVCSQNSDVCIEIIEEQLSECDEQEEGCEELPECNEEEMDCEELPECNEEEMDCEEIPECNEEEMNCEELPECNEEEMNCEEFPECNEEEMNCEEFPECNEEEMDCEELPECNEEEMDCEELPECNEEDMNCDESPECNEEEMNCEESPECNEEEEECPGIVVCQDGDDSCVASTGFINPNPLPDNTIMTVDKSAAHQAARFLSQATFGASYPLITQVAAIGEDAWLETQLQQPVGYLMPQVEFVASRAYATGQEELVEQAIGDPFAITTHAWWTQVMTSPDLVRQRVAFALSEIFVVSSRVEVLFDSPHAMAQYYDTLLKHSTGNFRDLLKDISLTPAMAVYLSHLNNAKADEVNGTFPDENYAREVMQLFSIGLFELNPDGSRKKDQSGNDIPTYNQDDIREFAKIFTGLSLDTEEGFGFIPDGNTDFREHAVTMKPLKMFDAFHSDGEKRLLNGTLVPAGQTGMQDIDAAIDNLFNHPNVGPFIGKQLIQRLVKSNPTPAYIARVTAAFNGQSGGVRGDMKAVIRAILMDPEARTSPSNAAKTDGRLREPFMRLVRLSRSFDATTPDRYYSAEGYEVLERIKQYVFWSPSVFNFFLPAYSPNGELKDAGLVAPEFQITNASTIIEIKNLVSLWVDTGRIEERNGRLAGETVSFEYEIALANNADALLDHLDTVLTYGTLSQPTRNIIKSVLENEPEAREKVKKAIYLIAISPEYAVAI